MAKQTRQRLRDTLVCPLHGWHTVRLIVHVRLRVPSLMCMRATGALITPFICTERQERGRERESILAGGQWRSRNSFRDHRRSVLCPAEGKCVCVGKSNGKLSLAVPVTDRAANGRTGACFGQCAGQLPGWPAPCSSLAGLPPTEPIF